MSEQEWLEGVDEDVAKVVGRFKEPQDLAKGYYNLNKKLSETPRIPKDDAPQEDWDKFHDLMGRPKSVDDYEMGKDNLPDDFPWDEDFEKQMKQVAHKAGVSQKQFKALAEQFVRYNTTSFAASQEASKSAREKANDELKKEFKLDDDGYKKFLNIARQAVKNVDDEKGSITAYLNSTGLGDDPVFIRLFHNIGMKILDDSFIEGKPPKEAKPTKNEFGDAFNKRFPKTNE